MLLQEKLQDAVPMETCRTTSWEVRRPAHTEIYSEVSCRVNRRRRRRKQTVPRRQRRKGGKLSRL